MLPGQAAAAAVAPRETSPLQALLAVARSAVPDNVAAAAVNMNILGIITFSLFFGLCLAGLGEQADGLISLVNVRLTSIFILSHIHTNSNAFGCSTKRVDILPGLLS